MADDEKSFRAWYSRMSAQYGLPSDPDDPSQFYDYRAAFRAGAKPDATKHWPSQFKKPGHPNEVVGGFNTRTGERVPGTKRASESELLNLGWDRESAKRLAAMTEPSTDPLQVFLDRTKLSTAQKAGLWDLYHAAKNTEDLDSRLKALDLPKEIKADLWDLKASEAIPEANAKDIPKAQTWADVLHKRAADPYGITAWEQGTGGMPMLIPAEAGAAGVELAKSAAQKGLSTLQRVAASAKSTGGEAATIAKAGGAYYATKYIGLPEPIPTIAAIIAGRSGGAGKGSVVAAEATAAESTPLGFPKTTQAAETPLEFSRRLKAEHQAVTGRTRLEAPAQPAARSPLKVDPKEFATEFKKLAKTPKLTAEEMSIGAKLLQSGMKAEDVLEKLLKRREFPSSWLALPTDADLAATIGARNATGKWPQP